MRERACAREEFLNSYVYRESKREGGENLVRAKKKNLLGSVKSAQTIKLFHERLGHRDKLFIVRVAKKDLLSGVKIPVPSEKEIEAEPLCPHCVAAKSTRRPLLARFNPLRRELVP